MTKKDFCIRTNRASNNQNNSSTFNKYKMPNQSTFKNKKISNFNNQRKQ